MNNSTLNRWLKPLAISLVIVLIVMLLIPAELTYTQLSQIKPGMTLQHARHLLGANYLKGGMLNGPTGYGFQTQELECIWLLEGKMWNPFQVAQIPIMTDKFTEYPPFIWVGRSHVLWIHTENTVIVYVCIVPITRTGGGIEGCIDTIKQYWYDWRN